MKTKTHKAGLFIDTQPIEHKVTEALVRKYGRLGKFCCPSFEKWVHPYNTVPNCLAILLDGFIYYKFRMLYDEKRNKLIYKVRQLPKSPYFSLNVKINEELTLEQLIQKISKSTIK